MGMYEYFTLCACVFVCVAVSVCILSQMLLVWVEDILMIIRDYSWGTAGACMDTDALPRFHRGNMRTHFQHDDNFLSLHNPNVFLCFL